MWKYLFRSVLSWQLLMFTLLSLVFVSAVSEQICVIGGMRSPVRSLTRLEVANIFQGRVVHGRRWRLIDLPNTSRTFQLFYRHVLGWDAADASAFWSQQVFGGGAALPQQVDRVSDVIALVRSSTQIIAYVPVTGSIGGVRLLYCFGQRHLGLSATSSDVSIHHQVNAAQALSKKSHGATERNRQPYNPQHASEGRTVNPLMHKEVFSSSNRHTKAHQVAPLAAKPPSVKPMTSMPSVNSLSIKRVTQKSVTKSPSWLSRLSTWWWGWFQSGSSKPLTPKVPSESKQLTDVRHSGLSVRHSNQVNPTVDHKENKQSSSVPLVMGKSFGVDSRQSALNQAASVAHHIETSATPVDPHSAVSSAGSSSSLNSDIPLELSDKASDSADLFTLAKAKTNTQVHPGQSGASLWPVLIKHFSLGDHSSNPRVKVEINWFLQHKKLLNANFQNAALYLYYVFEQTQKRGMPAEFALLPIIESNYNPYAYSQVGATGLWQLMPGTAMSHSLDISWWYDGRMDVMASTQSALDYIKHYGRAFGDWKLAAAAYNAGPGTVSKAREYAKSRALPSDFWHLALPKETMRYVPKLLALSYIVAHADQYGIKLPVIANSPYFTTIKMTSQIELVKAARLAGISAKLMRLLNPGFRRFATTPNTQYSLLIPVDHAKTFQNNLKLIAGQEQRTWIYHQARQGETLVKIAADYHTSVALLKQVNGLTTTTLSQDQGVLVPLSLHRRYSAAIIPSNAAPNWNSEQALPVAKQIRITVMPGQTLLSIATKYDVTVNQLLVWNQLDKNTGVKPGDRLSIWLVGEDDSTPFGSQKVSPSSDQRLNEALDKIYKSQ